MPSDEIYIILTATGTWFSRTIQLFTRAPLNHASISFDKDLNEVYSFGRKKLNNPFRSGFIREDFLNPFYDRAQCAVFRIRVGEFRYELMRRHVGEMLQCQDKYKYHLLGLIGVLLRKRIAKDHAYFCSSFVASVLERNGWAIGKPFYFMTPADFEQSFSSHEIYRGTVSGYMESIGRAYPRHAATGLRAAVNA